MRFDFKSLLVLQIGNEGMIQSITIIIPCLHSHPYVKRTSKSKLNPTETTLDRNATFCRHPAHEENERTWGKTLHLF